MPGPQFLAYPGQGEALRSQLWYSQPARIGDRIKISAESRYLLYPLSPLPFSSTPPPSTVPLNPQLTSSSRQEAKTPPPAS